jgi:hypothetical protein
MLNPPVKIFGHTLKPIPGIESIANSSKFWLLVIFYVGLLVMPKTRADIDLQHIDYILYAGALAPAEHYVIQDSAGSDHPPLLSSLEFILDSQIE